MISHQFHNDKCVSHDLTLSNSNLQSFQSIQKSLHYYIDKKKKLESLKDKIKVNFLVGSFSTKLEFILL